MPRRKCMLGLGWLSDCSILSWCPRLPWGFMSLCAGWDGPGRVEEARLDDDFLAISGSDRLAIG